ncbi:hypothetical protein [Thermomonas flagellata]|uniref:hypothetical protein n=1 Tax=Thermomonas flagellata TaxID=2888524 RepID=UPI001F03B132|nr:hypothetical protein [Thermomonas flagellata]
MPRKPTSAAAADTAPLTHERIAADLREFRKRGGKIEVLGNTPLRQFQAVSPFRSSPEQRKPPTPPASGRRKPAR